MAESSMVSYRRMSPNNSGPRKFPVTRITPHYVDGNPSVEQLGEWFSNRSRQASSNYGIGSDGRVALYVDENNRAWTSGNADNDNRAITIECCNLDGGVLTEACWDSLVELCADICRRYGIENCTYTGNDSGTLTMHKWFQDTDCPGPWLGERFDLLSQAVNEKLGVCPTRQLVSVADVAARIHYDMVTDERNGYSQEPRWGGDYGGELKTLVLYGRSYTYPLGSYDCSSSVICAWRLALQGTMYEGVLDRATYTGDMEAVFVASGLFSSSLTPARRGDLYLATAKHTAMCQDGGHDGTFGYDCLSEFNRNERHGATGGRPGDQDGQESVLRAYYDDGWDTVLHYNGRADWLATTDTPTSTGGDMVCILHLDEGPHLHYFDGQALHVILSQDEQVALDTVYQATHKGARIPMVKLGTKAAPYGRRLVDVLARGACE